MTDCLPAYGVFDGKRQTVRHSSNEFVRASAIGPPVHVNTAESCHADLRRMVLGVHHWISRKHLDRYLDDLSFRRSKRDDGLWDRLSMTVSASGRLMYSELTRA